MLRSVGLCLCAERLQRGEAQLTNKLAAVYALAGLVVLHAVPASESAAAACT
eukprot:SAG31_NODE_3381_length_4338_cov_90.056617_2_plen_52_part_00